MSKNNKQLTLLAISAIMSALSMLLSRFLSVNLWSMSVGFAFVPLLVCGVLCGPLWCGMAGAVADFVGAMLFPFGAYFPGFTATAFLNGFLYGTIGVIGKKIKNKWLFFLASLGIVTLSELICSLLLNSLWITLLYTKGFIPTLVLRIGPAVFTAVTAPFICLLTREKILPKLT